MLKQYVQRHGFGLNDGLGFDARKVCENWMRLRNSLSKKLQQPQLKMIRLYDLRHFFGSMTYYKTKDIVYTQRMMGHKNIQNTLRYVHLVGLDNGEFICKVAKTLAEASELIEQGFEFVCDMEDAKLFRKPK
jgi:hypothetical protein